MAEQLKSVGVFTTDRDLVVRSWDPWLAEATGIPESAAVGQALGALVPDAEERGLLPRVRRVVDSATVEVFAPAFHKYLIPCKPREPSPTFEHMRQHVTVSPLRNGNVVSGVVFTIEDVTPRLDRERALALELESQNEAIRLRATQSLAEAASAPSLLASALADKSWRVRRAAAEGLGAVGGAHAVDALIEALREHHRDPSVLNAALVALSRTKDDVVLSIGSLLAVDDADVRTYAALALGMLRDTRAVPGLIAALDDADVNVQYHAIEALGRIGDRSAAEPVARIAERRDFFLSFAALDALAAIGEPSVAQRVLPLLADPQLGAAAAVCLGAVATEDSAMALAACLSEPGAPIVEIAGALAAMHDRLEREYGEGALVADRVRRAIDVEAAHALVAALSRVGDDALEGLVVVLGWLPFDGIDRALARLLAHARLRERVAGILAARGEPAVVAIIEAARDAEPEVRKLAVMALGRIGSGVAAPFLVEQLAGETHVAVAAAGALGAIGDPLAFEALLSNLDHENGAVRQAAVAALNSIGHPAMSSRMRRLLEHDSPRVRESAAKVVGYFGYAECLEPLIGLCADRDEAVRRSAVEHLANFDDARAEAAMRQVTRRDPAPSVRAAAARALGRVSDAASRAALLDACRDENPWVRYYAARALANHAAGAGDVRATLESLADRDSMPPVRIAAIEALATDATYPRQLFLRLTANPEPEIAAAAIRALGGEAQITPDTARVLQDALAAGDAARQQAALEAISRSKTDEWVELVQTTAQSADSEVARHAVDALRAIGSRAAVRALAKLASSPARQAIVSSALTTMEEEQIQWLAETVSDPGATDGARCFVIETLGRTRHPAASRLVAAALSDRSPAVRLAATQALSRLDLREAEAQLAVLARSDESTAVRDAARGVLERSRHA